MKAERHEQSHGEPQSELWAAFEVGLRNVLTACATVLYSKRFLEYARLASADFSLGVGESFYRDGPQKLRNTLESFLSAEDCQSVAAVPDPEVAADQLICLLLGPEFLRVLLRGDRIEDNEVNAIVEMAMLAFVKIYGPSAHCARTFPYCDTKTAHGGTRSAGQDCLG